MFPLLPLNYLTSPTAPRNGLARRAADKRSRTLLDERQRSYLEECFMQCHYISRERRHEVASILGLPDETVRFLSRLLLLQFNSMLQIKAFNFQHVGATLVSKSTSEIEEGSLKAFVYTYF